MRMLYEQELRRFLDPNPTDTAIISYAQELVDSNNARNWQKASELSHLLRRENRHEASVGVARILYEKDPTVDKLNLYFVAVVDKGDIAEIRQLHQEVDQYVANHGHAYQKHLFATWLKAANRIQDDEMFKYVYENIPAEEKVENSYIVSQYYVYLNRRSRYTEVLAHYDTLSPNVQNAKYVRRYYENARARLGYARGNTLETPVYFPSDDLSTPNNIQSSGIPAQGGQKKCVFLVYGSNPIELTYIKLLLRPLGITYTDIADNPSGGTILEKFERYASEALFAVILLTPADQVIENGTAKEPIYHARQNVLLEWGYFLGKLGKDNIAVIVNRNEIGKKLVLPSDMLGTDVINFSSTNSDWIRKLAIRLHQAGFEIDPNNLPF